MGGKREGRRGGGEGSGGREGRKGAQDSFGEASGDSNPVSGRLLRDSAIQFISLSK